MSRGLKAVILLVVGLLAIGIAVWFGLRGPKPGSVSKSNETTTGTQTSPNAPVRGSEIIGGEPAGTPAKPPPAATERERDEAAIRLAATTFAERYGSYSSESSYANVRDVYPLVTARFRSVLETRATSSGAATSTPAYRGVTTVVLRVTIPTYNPGGATISSVATQRDTVTGSDSKVTYETLTLTLKRESNQWKIDDAAWSS